MSSDTNVIVNPDTYVRGVPHETFARLRAESAVVWMDEPAGNPWAPGPGFWAVLRHAEVKEVMRNPAVFSSYLGATQISDPPDEKALNFVRKMMLNQDPPGHSRLRRMLTRAFTPKAIARLEARIDSWAHELVAGVAERGECDFATDIAADLPLRTLAEVFGVPSEDRWLMYDWSNRVIGHQDTEYAQSAQASPEGSTDMARRALALRPLPDANGVMPDQRTREGMPDLYAYAHDLGEFKRRNPGEDIMSLLMSERASESMSQGDRERQDRACEGLSGSETGDERVTIPEFENMFWLFVVAGNETLRNALPGGMHALLSNVDQYRKVRADRSLLSLAVEEMLRWWSPVMRFRRTATVDTSLGGVRIVAGDKVVVWFSSANRDERVFGEPDRFDVTRRDNDHLSFGHGPHYCIGAHLAKVQMRAMFTAMFELLGEVEPAGEVVRLRSNFQHGVKHLPIRWRMR